jgi:hypothetical protein
VDSLKDKLVDLLESVVKNGLSGVLREIDDELERNTANMELLDQSMENAAERRSVFAAAVEEYTKLLDDAVTGKYRGNFFEFSKSDEMDGQYTQGKGLKCI